MLFAVVGFSALFVGVKLFERRLGKALVRAGIAFLLVVPLLGAAYAAWALSRHWVAPVDVALLAAFATVTGLGTSFGYHRLLTHRGFETYASIKAMALIAGAMAVPSRPIDWAARHLEHHAHADREGDPHSPLDGFLHAHVGWIFAVQPARRERYCRRLLEDRLVVAVDRTAELWFFAGLVVRRGLAQQPPRLPVDGRSRNRPAAARPDRSPDPPARPRRSHLGRPAAAVRTGRPAPPGARWAKCG
jgi:hypothetical protein